MSSMENLSSHLTILSFTCCLFTSFLCDLFWIILDILEIANMMRKLLFITGHKCFEVRMIQTDTNNHVSTTTGVWACSASFSVTFLFNIEQSLEFETIHIFHTKFWALSSDHCIVSRKSEFSYSVLSVSIIKFTFAKIKGIFRYLGWTMILLSLG